MIQSINDTQNFFQTNAVQPSSTQQTSVQNETNQASFSEFLKESINELNTQQVTSDRFTEALANGENIELHQVYIAAEKASTTMTAALEFRNKVIDAYQEIMRMSV